MGQFPSLSCSSPFLFRSSRARSSWSDRGNWEPSEDELYGLMKSISGMFTAILVQMEAVEVGMKRRNVRMEIKFVFRIFGDLLSKLKYIYKEVKEECSHNQLSLDGL